MSNTLPWRTLATPSTPSDLQRAFDRLALRIENAGFQGDGDAGFHGLMNDSLPQAVRMRLMHRGCRLLEQPAVAGDLAALADEPHRGPERRRASTTRPGCRALFERFGDAERAQAAAGDQDALGIAGVGDRAVAERDDVGLALVAGPPNSEIEAFEREHLEAGRGQQLASGCSVHDIAVGGGDGDALGADFAQAIDDGLAHAC